MDKQKYLKKFSREIRWRLPKAEADEVLADYKDIFEQYPDKDSDSLIQEFGKPRQAAQMLAESKAYYRWLMAFFLMAGCLLVPELWFQLGFYIRRETVTKMFIIGFGIAFIIGFITFRPCKGEKRKLAFPKGMLPMLLVLLLILAMVMSILVGLKKEIWNFLTFETCGHISVIILSYGSQIATLFGLFGLVKARMSDRRWFALYVMALTVLMECILVYFIIHSFNLSPTYFEWMVGNAMEMSKVAIVGLLGVGVSLC